MLSWSWYVAELVAGCLTVLYTSCCISRATVLPCHPHRPQHAEHTRLQPQCPTRRMHYKCATTTSTRRARETIVAWGPSTPVAGGDVMIGVGIPNGPGASP